MAMSRGSGLTDHLDTDKIFMEAQDSWLRPAEICDILKNYKKFSITSKPAHMPPSGSLFLFDRKVSKHFRKDGHNWRKKKDGKTVTEANERLKVGDIHTLHCYYAHGEENGNFQRRSYWMLEEDLSHIVLVHYRDVKGNRTNFNRLKETEETIPYRLETVGIISNSEVETMSSSFQPTNAQIPSQTMDATSMHSVQASEYEDAESVYDHQASSEFHSLLELQRPVVGRIDELCDPFPVSHSNDSYGKPSGTGFTSLEDYTPWDESAQFQPPFSLKKHENTGKIFDNSFPKMLEFEDLSPSQEECQAASEGDSLHSTKRPLEQKLHPDSRHDLTSRFHEQERYHHMHLDKRIDHSTQNNQQTDPSNGNHGYVPKPDSESNLTLEGKSFYSSAMGQHMFYDSLEGMEKVDSFSQRISIELGNVDESHIHFSYGALWDAVEGQNGVDVSTIPSQGLSDTFMLDPSLSHEQLLSIIDFSPKWAYVGSEIKVFITVKFLKNREEAKNCKWSCMFGKVEVPAKVIADGVLSCHTPRHVAGRVPLYVTCSNRLACSEVLEFEYRLRHIHDTNTKDHRSNSSNAIEILMIRFGSLLCLGEEIFLKKMEEQLLQKLLKEELLVWLLQKIAEGGKGPSILDEGGQGVIHFAAALGYDWALELIIRAGVSVNFRDVNGWTALHWAASRGRERTVASLISLGAAPGTITDPTRECPLGRTPADLALAYGHKGISGYLAESDLGSFLSLNLDNQGCNDTMNSRADIIQKTLKHNLNSVSYGDADSDDALAAVRNATQAAACIHQVFRLKSSQKMQLQEFGDDKFGRSDKRALSLTVVNSNEPGQHNEHVHVGAIHIENKFLGWKGRKEFSIIHQRIVKIQAHVRGHQVRKNYRKIILSVLRAHVRGHRVRKNYRKIIWSVGILEKVILRWRRKGSGLRGFKLAKLTEGRSIHGPSEEDDYDFLKEGRKQTEERLQKALARVESMAQNHAGRHQYRRIKNVVTEIQVTSLADYVR